MCIPKQHSLHRECSLDEGGLKVFAGKEWKQKETKKHWRGFGDRKREREIKLVKEYEGQTTLTLFPKQSLIVGKHPR